MKTWIEQLRENDPEIGIHGTWQSQHYIERSAAAHPIAQLLNAVTTGVRNYEREWPDSNTTRGYGEILEGIIVLLNEDTGGMDSGTLWTEIATLAETIRWDLDMSEITYD